jgi:hypothetical protein
MNNPIGRNRQRHQTGLIHPMGHEWNKGKPGQQRQVRPQHPAVDVTRGVQQVMAVVPENSHIDEAQRVGEKIGAPSASAARSAPCGTLISSTIKQLNVCSLNVNL